MQKLVHPVVNALDILLHSIKGNIGESREKTEKLSTNVYESYKSPQARRVKKKKTMQRKGGYFVQGTSGDRNGLRHYESYELGQKTGSYELSIDYSRDSENSETDRKKKAEAGLLNSHTMGPQGKMRDDLPQGQEGSSDLLKKVLEINKQRSSNFTNP